MKQLSQSSNTSITSHSYLFCVRILKIYFLSIFQVYNAMLLTIVIRFLPVLFLYNHLPEKCLSGILLEVNEY